MSEMRVVVKEGPAAGSDHPIADGLTIGREPGVDLVLEDAGVSRRHASLRVDGQTVVIDDLGSSNGTFVNGERIEGPRRIRERDEIQLGDTVLEIQGGGTATALIGASEPTEIRTPPSRRRPAPPQPRAVPRQPRPTGPLDAETNIPAFLAFFLGPLSLFLVIFSSGGAFYVALPCAIGAIVAGSIGKRKVDSGEADRHRGLALAGQVCGIVGAALATLALIAVILIDVLLDAGAESLQEIVDQIEAELDDGRGDVGDLIERAR